MKTYRGELVTHNETCIYFAGKKLRLTTVYPMSNLKGCNSDNVDWAIPDPKYKPPFHDEPEKLQYPPELLDPPADVYVENNMGKLTVNV